MTEHDLDTPGEQALMERMEDLLRRAAMARLLAQGFTYPGEGAHAALLEQMEAMRPGLSPELAEPFGVLRDRLGETTEDALQAEHCRLFQARKVVSLHETSYGDAQRIGGQVVELSDINGFYRAFGMQSSEVNPEMPDHLCTELEFYSLMLVKQAYALDNGWDDEESVTADAVRKFLEYHLARWIEPMVAVLREQGGDAVAYVALGELLTRMVALECRLQEVTPQPFSGPFPLDPDLQGDAFNCPMAAKPEEPVVAT